MKDTLHFILTQIVDHPQDIAIDENTSDNHTVFTVMAHPEDMGKIIGKHGRIIQAIRDIIKILAIKHNTYVDIQLRDQTPIQEEQPQKDSGQQS